MLNRTRGHSFRPRATGQCVVLTIFTGRTESAVWARRASTRPTGTPNRRRHVPSAWALSVGVKRGNNIVRWVGALVPDSTIVSRSWIHITDRFAWISVSNEALIARGKSGPD